MNQNAISISQLARVFTCIFAGVLPQVRHSSKRWASRGTALHKFLADTLTLGWAVALELVEPDFYEECKVIDMTRLPKSGEYAAEVAWAYNWREDTARELGRGLDRRYDGLVDERSEIAGTADVVGLTAEAVVVLDYKTGWADLGPVANSWQLKGYAVAAARAYKRAKAIIGFIRIRQDGTPFFDVLELSAMEVDAAAQEIRSLLRLVSIVRTNQGGADALVYDDGDGMRDHGRLAPAQYVEGPHCNRCASLPFCAAKMRLVAQLAGAPMQLLDPGSVPVLSERELSVAYQRLELIKDLVERVEYALKDRASVTPFPIEGKPGWVYGPMELTVDDVQVDATVDELAKRFGPAVANKSTTVEISKASIERAIKETGWLTEAPGRKITPTMRTLVDHLRETGAIKRVTSWPVRAHKAKENEDEKPVLPPPVLRALPGGEQEEGRNDGEETR